MATGTNTAKLFCCNWTAVKLWQDFDALFYTINGFCIWKFAPSRWKCPTKASTNMSTWKPRASHPMHQNLTIILWQFNYGKNSLPVLILGPITSVKLNLHWSRLKTSEWHVSITCSRATMRAVAPISFWRLMSQTSDLSTIFRMAIGFGLRLAIRCRTPSWSNSSYYLC